MSGQMSEKKQHALHKRMTLHRAAPREGGTIMLNLVESIQLQRKHQERVANYAAERAIAGGLGPWGPMHDTTAAMARQHDTTGSISYGGGGGGAAALQTAGFGGSGEEFRLGLSSQPITGDDSDLYTAHRSNGAYGSEDEEDD